MNATDTMDNCTYCHSFKKLCQGDKSFKFHPHSECPLMSFDESLDTVITNFTHPKVNKLAETFSKYRATFQRQMHALDFNFKLDKWIPLQLTVTPRVESISIYVSWFSFNCKERYFEENCDERWEVNTVPEFEASKYRVPIFRSVFHRS